MSEVILRANQITKVDSVVTDPMTVNFEKATIGSEYKLIFTTDATSKISINFLANIKWEKSSELVLENDKIYEFDFVLYHGVVLGSFVSYDNRYVITGNYSGCHPNNKDVLLSTKSSYYSAIIADPGHTLEGASVSIIMNDKEISDVVYTDGIIFIKSVTGDVTITISAGEDTSGTGSGTSDPSNVTTDPDSNVNNPQDIDEIFDSAYEDIFGGEE